MRRHRLALVCGAIASALYLVAWLRVRPTGSRQRDGDTECVSEAQLDGFAPSPFVDEARSVFAQIREAAQWPADKPVCGCLFLDAAAHGNRHCARAPAAVDASACQWLMFIGDSTVRQFFQNVLFAANRARTPPAIELWFDGVPASPRDQDLDWRTVLNADLRIARTFVVSYRSLLTLTSSKAMALLRRPHNYALTRNASDGAVFRRFPGASALDSTPVLDEAFFAEEPGPLHALRCVRPGLVLASAGLWENDLWSPRLEQHRCGLHNANLERLLFTRRLKAFLAEARLQAGSVVWRTSAVPLSQRYPSTRVASAFKLTPHLNDVGKRLAARAGVPVLDYAALHERMGNVSLDTTHPVDYIAATALGSLLHFASALKETSALADALLPAVTAHAAALRDEWDGKAKGAWMVTTATPEARVRALFHGAFDKPLPTAPPLNDDAVYASLFHTSSRAPSCEAGN